MTPGRRRRVLLWSIVVPLVIVLGYLLWQVVYVATRQDTVV
ncbi:hypothetical protein Cfla_3525 [Cellulomonas flavigena DSM 20109]|uniref:Uncharacterized protein n=1 Tax=Cellulomonas flavigena (strain ATCC 482 / DSM 20109 / BCRC 11376 / JCM 18109 / NBRC 3775 / NCIMB 8073 / NRS 134) TaxID=446466 RepID=D5UDE1_CELFN|nr:hypothetical protein [Cellulomonas flavigena]ADG76397.1 hypothetical protein Cfla_3525 [Cellulomonas flavigena DSM 20109]